VPPRAPHDEDAVGQEGRHAVRQDVEGVRQALLQGRLHVEGVRRHQVQAPVRQADAQEHEAGHQPDQDVHGSVVARVGRH